MATYITSPFNPLPNERFTITWIPSPAKRPLQLDTYDLFLISDTYSIDTTVYGSGESITFILNSGVPFGVYSLYVSSPTYYEVANETLIITCFVEGSEILCLVNDEEEYIKVEDLKIGNLVKTYNNSPKKITHIIKKIFKNDKSHSQICKLFRYPNQTKDLYLTGGHSILVDNLTEEQKEKTLKVWGKLKKIDDKFLLLCFIDESNKKIEKIEDNKEYNIYHIILENTDSEGQYGIYANGILTESMSINCYLELSNLLVVKKNAFII